MYKILLVDDEINILEGIAAIVDWEACGTELMAKAHHGQMAFDIITERQPDIVVTDIKMPGLNGVQLIRKVHDIYPEIRFIVLSGHDEFEFAKTAMECNVKHYLLKPSNEQKIEKALKEVVSDLDEEQGRQEFLESMRDHLKKVMPKAKEQFLKDYITNKKYSVKDWEYYSQLFEIDTDSKEFYLLVIEMEDSYDYEHLLALKKIMVEEVGESHIPLETTIGDKIVILIELDSREFIIEKVKGAKQSFHSYYPIDYTVAISNLGSINQLRNLYNETLDCLTQRFYVPGGSIITPQDINHQSSMEELQYDHEDLIYAIRSGNKEVVQQYLDDFFNEVWQEKYAVNLLRSHCLELFMSMIRQADRKQIDEYFKQVILFQEYERFQDMKGFIEKTALEISHYHYERTKQTQSTIINRVVEFVEKNLSDENLSLSHIATDVLYMNSDYLGKLFKKEKGERFSSFLINRRMEKARELFEHSDQVKIFEVAEAVGFGNNPRYFGQVFKKHTGVTPSNYLKKE
ncbi:two-component system, response regulator YesN [Halobacillus dabanensis]|uniref:Two-component system, response regulator YesN n=1 Tax=Halobacillus dabanensis TaxID=240302 RepID=A0A1I3RUS6_HALDA|nr:response regulator [Halobacillus dabanensis]SFJ50313.1 two-component system, response regulator YesN [Halobacillus dabanensis]